jgi:hypothetical protein
MLQRARPWWLVVAVVVGALAWRTTPGSTQPFQSHLLLGSFSGASPVGVTSGTGSALSTRRSPALTVYFQSIGTTSGGTVVIEEASWNPTIEASPYAGTWSQITAVNASTFSGGAQLAYRVASPTTIHFIRARVSSNITGGGSVVVRIAGN